jgi:archaellum biogenesis ATPase FlaH
MTNENQLIEIEARMSMLRVDYQPHNAAYKLLKHRIDMAIHHHYKGACVISGDTGTGKSTLTTRILTDYPIVEGVESTSIPVVYFQLGAKPTIKGILEGLLAQYLQHVPQRSTEQKLFRQLKIQMKECGTHVVVLDDAQHLIEDGRRVSIHSAADDLKVLIDAGVLLVFCGTPNVLSIFSTNSQLRRRFSTRVHLQPLALKKDDIQMLQVTALALFNESGAELTADHLDGEFWVKLHFATNGNIAYINTLIAATAVEALRNGRKIVMEKDFHKAFREQIFHDAKPATNPFDSKFKPRVLNAAGEPFENMEIAA